MAIRSRPFWSLACPALAQTIVYTVPANRTALCRLWTITNSNAQAVVITARVNRGAGNVTLWHGTIAVGSTAQVPVPVILDEGDTFVVNNTDLLLAVASCGFGSLLMGDPA